jgi:hypothetical protein
VNKGIGISRILNFTMERTNSDPAIRFLVFHGTRRDDVEKTWFILKDIWIMVKVINEVVNIT